MNLLITGASGFIGAYVVREALQRGHSVIAMVRDKSKLDEKLLSKVSILQHDLSATNYPRLSELNIDCVIHLVASLSGNHDISNQSTVEGTERLLLSCQEAGITKIVGISSISVLNYLSVKPMSSVDESCSLVDDMSAMGSYAAMKLNQENVFRKYSNNKLKCTIIRPGLVFDDDNLIDAHAGILKGPMNILVEHGGEVPTVEVHGLAKAIIMAAESDLPNNTTIHLVDDNLPGQSAYLDGLRRRGLLPSKGIKLSWKVLFYFITLTRACVIVMGLRNKVPEILLPQSFALRMKPLRYSNKKAKDLLGWQPGSGFY